MMALGSWQEVRAVIRNGKLEGPKGKRPARRLQVELNLAASARPCPGKNVKSGACRLTSPQRKRGSAFPCLRCGLVGVLFHLQRLRQLVDVVLVVEEVNRHAQPADARCVAL